MNKFDKQMIKQTITLMDDTKKKQICHCWILFCDTELSQRFDRNK